MPYRSNRELLAETDYAWQDIYKAHNGVWIGCKIPEDLAQGLAIPHGESAEDLHLTLLYIKNAATLEAIGIGKILGIVSMVAATAPPIIGIVSGIGRFLASETSDGKDVLVALYDSPSLSSLHEQLFARLSAINIVPSQAHGYQPHISLAMLDPGQSEPQNILIEAMPLTFETLLVRWPDGEEAYPLTGTIAKRIADHRLFLIKTAKQRYTLGVVYEPDTLDTDEEYARAPAIQRACWGFMRKLQQPAVLTKGAMRLLDTIIKSLQSHDALRLDVTELLATWDTIAKGRLGDQHSSWDDAYGEIVECYIAPCDMQLGAEIVKAGTWLLGVVWSPEQFAKIESGERTGYSMGGVGRAEYQEALHHAA